MLNISLARYYFEGSFPLSPQDYVIYQLHNFSNASKCAYESVVYLRRLANGVATVAIVQGRVEVVYSDNGSTFQAASKALPKLLHSTKLKNSLCGKRNRREFIPLYAPDQGGTWESMVKQVKRILQKTPDTTTHNPNLSELITFCSNAVRVVDKRPIMALSKDPGDFAVVTPASLLTPGFDTYSPAGRAYDRDHSRKDCRFNLGLADCFWKSWEVFYLPILQRRNTVNGEKLLRTYKQGWGASLI